MIIFNILTVIAILIGPVLAIQIERRLVKKRESHNRKLSVFKTLMATRGTPISYLHVEALNRIDLEFSNDKKYDKVIKTWKEYFDNLSQKDSNIEIWISKNNELL